MLLDLIDAGVHPEALADGKFIEAVQTGSTRNIFVVVVVVVLFEIDLPLHVVVADIRAPDSFSSTVHS